jgi:hypothetical protein
MKINSIVTTLMAFESASTRSLKIEKLKNPSGGCQMAPHEQR